MADGAGDVAAQTLVLLQGARATQGDGVNRLLEVRNELQERRATARTELQMQRAAALNELRNVRRRQARNVGGVRSLTDSQLLSIVVSRAAKATARARGR